MAAFNNNYITLFLPQKVFSLLHSFYVFLFSFISTYIFRTLKKNDEKIINPHETEQLLLLDYKDGTEFRESDHDSEKEEEEENNSGLYLKFKFPTFEEFNKIQNEKEGINILNFSEEVVPCSTSSSEKYEFTSGNSFINAFIDNDDVDIQTYPVNEINANANFSENEEPFIDGTFPEKGNVVNGKGKEVLVFEVEGNENIVRSEVEDSMDSDSESMSFDQMRSVVNGLVDSYSDGFLSDGDFGEGNEMMASDNELDGINEDEEKEIMEEMKKLEEDNSNVEMKSVFLCEKDFSEDLKNKFVNTENEENCEKSKSMESEIKLESLWEHQELIDQLKMELRKVRATGLPTILEESESPKIMDDLKPWKIDDKFQREDCIGELHKFYKSYRDKMRKFDILNYQKMYAMGFLQLKDPLPSTSLQKPSPPTLKSLVSQNLWLFKHKIHGTDPMKKFIKELEGDLEMVYVGQLCLSWEFLHWQYEKALDLWDSDPRGVRRYNEVAGEFQQFQVLMQRFIEDEPFQGPRVQHYVKSRCVLRNLVQVPVIREDNMKDKRKARKYDGDEYVITSDMLVEIVEESIRIFWQFVRTDKDCATVINGNKKMPDQLHNPEDVKLLQEVRKSLQKKERKVKDLLRSENCILKKFRRHKEDDTDTDQVLYFFSQVDMKLVSRVLNMPKITTDQLMWCHNKLSRINLVDRKIYVEPAFLLFPC